MTVRVRVEVFGRVQGVWFRDTLRRTAEQHAVAGWARNRADGSVEAAFEGEPEDVEACIAAASVGPRRAEVERVERHDEPPEGLAGFDVS